tara:strand:- start:98 stop:337 length:240 start_codon:yes stop_codon:yes gene_type:complete
MAKQSLTIDDIVIFKDDLESIASKDVFTMLVTLEAERRKLNMQMMNVNFSIGGFSNTLIGLINEESNAPTSTEKESKDS